MKRIKVIEPRNMVIEEAPIPVPQEGEVLIEVELAGICGSDVGMYFGTMIGYATYPRVGGHEVSAIVVDTNNCDTDLKVGDRVTVSPYFNCGKCYTCRRGLTNCCQNNKTMGLPIDGIYAQYVAVRADKVYKAEGLTAKETVLVEPFCIGWHAAKIAAPKKGERALVVGAGTIGTFTMVSLKLQGAEVYVANRSPERLKMSKVMGADGVICYGSDEELVEEMMKITDGDGFDILVDAVGNPKVLDNCLAGACQGARVIEVGITAQPADFPLSMVQKKEVKLLGSRNAVRSDFDEVMQIIRDKKVDIMPMITAEYVIGDCLEVFEHAKESKGLKGIIDFSEEANQ